MTPTMMSGPFVLGCCWSRKLIAFPSFYPATTSRSNNLKHGGRTIYLFLLLYKKKIGMYKKNSLNNNNNNNNIQPEREISIIYIYIYMRDHEKLKSRKKQIVLLLFPCWRWCWILFSSSAQAVPPPTPKQLCVLWGGPAVLYNSDSLERRSGRAFIYILPRFSTIRFSTMTSNSQRVFVCVKSERVENREETDAVYRREQTRLCVMWDLAV